VTKQFKLGCLAAVAAVLALPTTAGALKPAPHSPTGDYSVFNDCPTETSTVELCMAGVTTTGGVQVGKLSVPITSPWYLQGGLHEGSGGRLEFIPAADGQSLAMAPDEIPGGIFSVVNERRYPRFLRDFCKAFPKTATCKVTAVAEVVGEPHLNSTNLIFEEGVAFEIPLRVHLKNPFVGDRCYVGTAQEPIVVALTTGTTTPPPPNTAIKGSAGALEITDEGNKITLTGTSLVDNSFAVPGVTGCGGPQSLNVDREIDRVVGLPSPAGSNSAELGGSLYLGVAASVRASE